MRRIATLLVCALASALALAVPVVPALASTPDVPLDLSSFPSLGGVGLQWRINGAGIRPASFGVYRRDQPTDVFAKVADVPGPCCDLRFGYVDTTLAAGASAQYAVSGVGDGAESALSDSADASRPANDPAVGTIDAFTLDAAPSAYLDSGSFDAARDGETVGLSTATAPGSYASFGLPVVPRPGTYVVHSPSPAPGEVDFLLAINSKGCSSMSGTLVVAEAAFDVARQPQVYTARYAVTCGPDPTAYGEIRWHSTASYIAASAPRSDDAGYTPIGTPLVRHVTLASRGSAPVTFSAPVVTGAEASDWSVTGESCTGPPVAPLGTCTVDLSFAPGAPGQREALLDVPDNTQRGHRLVRLTGGGAVAPETPAVFVGGTVGRIHLWWPAPNDGGLPITEYRIQRGTSPSGPLAQIATTSSTSWTDAHLAAGSSYRYSVVAVNGAGTSPPSGPTTATTARHDVVFVGAASPSDPFGLYAIGEDGGPRTPLEVDGADHATPAVSPEGAWVVYSRDAGSNSDLWKRPTAGGAAVRLTASASCEYDPAWSRDGKTIAYTSVPCSGPGQPSVRTMPAAGGSSTLRIVGFADPSWLPDNVTLIATSFSSASAPLARIGANGGHTALLSTGYGQEPEVSPSGRFVAYVTGDPASGKGLLRVAPISGTESNMTVDDSAPDWAEPHWAGNDTRLVAMAGAYPDPDLRWLTFTGSTVTAGPHLTGSGFGELEPVFRALGVRFTTMPRLTTAAAHLAFAVPESPAGLTFTCQVDTRTPVTCSSPYSPSPLTTGQHRLVVTAHVPAEPDTVAALTWTVDAAAPVARMTGPASPVVLNSYALWKWTATDSGSGVASYDVRYRRAPYSGAPGGYYYPALWQHTTSGGTSSLATPPGYEYCMSVRARDVAGNVSGWSAERCVAAPVDDRSFSQSGGWVRGTRSSAYRGTITSTSRANVTLTRTSVEVRRLYLVATRCPTCGAVGVYLGNVLVGTVDLHASTTVRSAVLPAIALSSLRRGTLVLKTKRSGLTEIDGVAVRRQ